MEPLAREARIREGAGGDMHAAERIVAGGPDFGSARVGREDRAADVVGADVGVHAALDHGDDWPSQARSAFGGISRRSIGRVGPHWARIEAGSSGGGRYPSCGLISDTEGYRLTLSGDPLNLSDLLLQWYDRHARVMPWRVSPQDRAAGQR
jgi:hypothetical protein